MSTQRSGPGAPTILAGVLILVETAFWIFVGGAMLVAALLLGRESGDASFIPISIGAVRGIFAVIGVVVLVLCATTIVVGIGVLRRRTWARWTGVGLFSVFGLMVLASILGSGDDPDLAGRIVSFIFFLADAGIVVLLALPSTGRDFRPVAVGTPHEGQGFPTTTSP